MKRVYSKKDFLEIHNLGEFLEAGYNLQNATIQNIDFRKLDINWASLDVNHATFLGCRFSDEDFSQIIKGKATIFPAQPDLVFNPYRSYLYTWQELYKGHPIEDNVDLAIYSHFSETKYAPSMMKSFYQRIHDHSIDDALRDYLVPNDHGEYKQKSIGIMGGHGTKRSDPYYRKVAHIAQQLTQEGYLILSGGGPGIMEAANLGAYMANYSSADLDNALQILQVAQVFTDSEFHASAVKVLEKYPNGKDTIAIPTWFYGHEPSNLFASHIAKYFSNSIREDTLLAVCIHGILFAPGSAGTTQEIFMDAAQNHYKTFDYISPMIFLGKDRYTKDSRIYDTIMELSKDKLYQQLIHLVDEIDEAVEAFKKSPPIQTA